MHYKAPRFDTFRFLLFSFFIFLVNTTLYSQNLNDNQTEIEAILNYIKKSERNNEKIDLYFSLCKLYQKSDIVKSNYYAEELLDFAKKVNNKKGIAYYNLIKSYNYIYEGNYNKAISVSLEAAYILKEKKYFDLYLDAIYFQVVANYFLGNYQDSNRIAFAAISKYKNGQNYKQIGLLFNLIGANYSSLDKSHLALQNFERASYFFLKAKDNFGLLKCYNQIADIYFKLNQDIHALNYSKKAIQIANEIKNIDIQSYTILLLFNTEINLKLKKVAPVSSNLNKINVLLQKIDNKGLKAFYYLLHADLCYLKKNYDLSIIYCNKAKELNVDYENSKTRIDYQLAKSYHQINQTAEASIYFKKIEQELIKNNSQYIGINTAAFYFDYADNEKSIGNYKKAYDLLKKYSEWQKNKTENENKERILYLLTKYDLNQKEIEIKNNFIDKQKMILELQKSNYKMYFFITILLFAVLLFLFFFYKFKKEKIFNQLVSDKSKTIEEKNVLIENSLAKLEQLLKTKEVLLKEIHHRVKNNLQLVMSLLRSQARNGADNDIHDFIEKSQSRIGAIALIHQNLYQSPQVEKVDIQEYISCLCETIIESSSKDTTKIVAKVNANNVFLDISIAIPIGLIINELITNVIKYAYPNVSSGLISIDIKNVNDTVYQLVVIDYGIGIDYQYKKKNSFGMELVSLLVEQIGGSLSLINEEGLQYNIIFDSNNHE